MSVVLYEKKGKIAYITLNRPDRLNAINREIVRELAKIWVDFRDDDNLWVGIVRGEGRSFCAGADLAGTETRKWKMRDSNTLGDDRVGPSNYHVWKPLIAAVHRHVIGAGFWLALECDIRIAAEDAVFSFPEPKVGVPTVITGFIPDYLPRGVAAELLLLGDEIDAQRAYQLGVVNRIVPADQLISTATAMAERLLENAPLAVWAMKEMLWRSRDMDYRSVEAFAEHAFTPVVHSEDCANALQAFVEKRKPRWQGK